MVGLNYVWVVTKYERNLHSSTTTLKHQQRSHNANTEQKVRKSAKVSYDTKQNDKNVQEILGLY